MRKKPEEFRPAEHADTCIFNIQRDGEHVGADESGARLYCTSSGKDPRWALQVRARVKAQGRPIEDAKQFAVATASLSKKDLLWLRALIDAELGGKS